MRGHYSDAKKSKETHAIQMVNLAPREAGKRKLEGVSQAVTAAAAKRRQHEGVPQQTSRHGGGGGGGVGGGGVGGNAAASNALSTRARLASPPVWQTKHPRAPTHPCVAE